jgi:hypothetical protein
LSWRLSAERKPLQARQQRENIGGDALVNELSALLIDWPFELMMSARTAAAPDWGEVELPESTVSDVVALEAGP